MLKTLDYNKKNSFRTLETFLERRKSFQRKRPSRRPKMEE